MRITELPALPHPWPDPFLPEALATRLLATPHHTLWGLGQAGEGATWLAYAMVHTPPAASADLLTLFVPPEHRRHGHARTLLEHIRTTLTQPLVLEVAATNHPAIALYTSLGATQIARRAAYYPPTAPGQPRTDALVLQLLPV